MLALAQKLVKHNVDILRVLLIHLVPVEVGGDAIGELQLTFD